MHLRTGYTGQPYWLWALCNKQVFLILQRHKSKAQNKLANETNARKNKVTKVGVWIFYDKNKQIHYASYIVTDGRDGRT